MTKKYYWCVSLSFYKDIYYLSLSSAGSNEIWNYAFSVVVIFRLLSVCLCFTSLFTLNTAEWFTQTAFLETQQSCFLNCWSFCVQAVALDKEWCVDLEDWNVILNLDVFLVFFSATLSLILIVVWKLIVVKNTITFRITLRVGFSVILFIEWLNLNISTGV